MTVSRTSTRGFSQRTEIMRTYLRHRFDAALVRDVARASQALQVHFERASNTHFPLLRCGHYARLSARYRDAPTTAVFLVFQKTGESAEPPQLNWSAPMFGKWMNSSCPPSPSKNAVVFRDLSNERKSPLPSWFNLSSEAGFGDEVGCVRRGYQGLERLPGGLPHQERFSHRSGV